MKDRELTEEAVHAMLDFRLAHVGINCADESQAKKTAETFEQLFGFGAEEIRPPFFPEAMWKA